jgi:large repetitive protein
VYVVRAKATDRATNQTDAGPYLITVDTTAPEAALLDAGQAFPAGYWFNRDVAPTLSVTDLTSVTVEALVDDVPATFTRIGGDGESSAWAGPTISAGGAHSIFVTITDQAGHATTIGPVTFHIDRTKPAITLASPEPGAVVTSARVSLSGAADDATTVTVNGVAATIDPAASTWTSSISLLEGTNMLTIVGTDRAGNVEEFAPMLVLDTRGPALKVVAPANGACTKLADLVVHGTASDARLASVGARISGPGAGEDHPATIDASTGTWSVTIPGVPEGLHTLVVTATDAAGHTSTATLDVRIDRTRPEIEVTEGGALFAVPVVGRALALFVRAIDADPSVSVSSVLDGTPFMSGSNIAAEGSHTLVVTARDCAGNETSESKSFTIDLTPPSIGALTPVNGSEVGDLPDSITGTIDDTHSDVVTVELVGTGIAAAPVSDTFTLSGVPFAEGANRFTLRARDAAGNEAIVEYVVTVRTEAPVVTISESGTPIIDGALFNRDVTPEIVSSDPEATITATLDGAAYAPGTAITAEGAHTLVATATNTLNRSGSSTVSFTIDKSGPAVSITSPVGGASIETAIVAVTGTASGAVSVLVNGSAAALSGTTFSAGVALDLGENLITAVARDEAGNTARADVTVTRAGSGPAIVLLHPPDKSLTNRPKTEVLGRVISPAAVERVRVEGEGLELRAWSSGWMRRVISGYRMCSCGKGRTPSPRLRSVRTERRLLSPSA